VNAPQSTGIFGGYPGSNVDYIIFRDGIAFNKEELPTNLQSSSGEEINHVQWGVFTLQDGDMLYIRFMGGGGYGDPIDRDPELVLKDVMDDLVSIECAKDIYGVSIDTEKNEINSKNTQDQRTLIRQKRLNGNMVKFTEKIVGISETDSPISEYLQVYGSESEGHFQCRWCGELICEVKIPWKSEVPNRLLPIREAGPLRAENNQFFLREFYCPHCATLLDTEVTLKDDPFLNDDVL
jgi:N-methylhydantoinase B